MWTGWIALCGTMFTYMDGMVHPYYTVAMAPAVSALVGLGGVWAWRHRAHRSGVAALAVMITLAAGWSVWLLHRAGLGPTWPRWAIGLAAVAAVVMIGSRWATAGPGRGPARGHRRCHRIRYRHREPRPTTGPSPTRCTPRRMADRR